MDTPASPPVPEPAGDDPAGDDPAGDDPAGDDSAVDELAALVGIDDLAVARIEFEERVAKDRLATIEAGRRKAGLLGAAAAGAMLGLRDVYEGPPKDDTIVAIVESPDEPGDIDTDGIEVTVGDVDVWAPPPPRRDDEAV